MFLHGVHPLQPTPGLQHTQVDGAVRTVSCHCITVDALCASAVAAGHSTNASYANRGGAQPRQLAAMACLVAGWLPTAVKKTWSSAARLLHSALRERLAFADSFWRQPAGRCATRSVLRRQRTHRLARLPCRTAPHRCSCPCCACCCPGRRLTTWLHSSCSAGLWLTHRTWLQEAAPCWPSMWERSRPTCSQRGRGCGEAGRRAHASSWLEQQRPIGRRVLRAHSQNAFPGWTHKPCTKPTRGHHWLPTLLICW